MSGAHLMWSGEEVGTHMAERISMRLEAVLVSTSVKTAERVLKEENFPCLTVSEVRVHCVLICGKAVCLGGSLGQRKNASGSHTMRAGQGHSLHTLQKHTFSSMLST